ncbi:DHA2 family efflux MFS transporter permease subunit [Nocardia sp. CA-136227]|uniref:DHA2 family efflux MFS transporter permease subunit n=1 Tax=Nocardia sp. CA-136227 TaxID=3239979 RepID=UPI003D9651DA
MTDPRPTTGFDPALRKLMFVVVLGGTMTVLDTTITNVAVHTLGTQFDTTLSAVQWVLTGYTLALSMSIPLSGWAVVRFGTKTMWILSLVLFIAGSVLCGLAWNIVSLVVFRLLQGLGAGMILPIGQTMLAHAAGPERMGRVMSVGAVPAMLAPVLGPVVGGLILSHLSWRWMFYINVPLCAIAVVAAVRLLPRDHVRDRAVSLDILGLGLLSPGLGALVYGTSQAGGGTGLTDTRTVAALLLGIALVAGYVLHAARKGTAALVDVQLLRDRNFALVNLIMFAYIGTMSGLMALLPLHFQTVDADSPLRSGVMVAPLGVGAIATMMIGGKLTDKLSPWLLILMGLPVILGGVVGVAQVPADASDLLRLLPLFVIGLGHGLMMPAVMSAGYLTLRASEIPAATTATNVNLRAASSFGVAALFMLLQHNIVSRVPDAGGGAEALSRPGRTADAAQAFAHAFSQTYWWAFIFIAIALVPALMLRRRSASRPSSEPAPIAAPSRSATSTVTPPEP